MEENINHILILLRTILEIANATQFTHFIPNLEARRKCDASQAGLDEALQQNVDDCWKTIALPTRFLKSTERRDNIIDLKLLGIVLLVEYIKYYSMDKLFMVLTDHRAILSFMKTHVTNSVIIVVYRDR